MLDIEWRWVDVDGSQSVVTFEQLTDALSSQALPPFTLVWRTGWTDWLSASRVADLAGAFGIAHSAPLTAVRITETALAPPAPPLQQYQTLSPDRPATLLRPKRAGALSTVPPPPPPRPGRPPPRMPTPDLPIPPPIFGIAPVPIRDVQPTLAGEEAPVRSPTLRPVGGMPPPPRTMPQPKLPTIDEGDIDLSGVENADTVRADEEDVDVAVEPPPAEMPRKPPPFQKPIPPKDMISTQRSAEGSPVARTSGAAASGSLKPRAPAKDLAGASRKAVTRATAIGVLLPGTLLLTAALVRLWLKPPRGAETPRADSQVAAAAVVSAAPPAAAGCSIAQPATRLAEAVLFSVPVLVATTPDGARAAVGFAATKEHARGIVIDPQTLSVSSAFEQTVTDSTTLGVVPLARGKALEFAVDRADPKLASARTIDAATRFTIGVTEGGLSRAVGDAVDVIWPGKSKNPTITTPRVASVTGVGHAVAFRHGGQEGKILVGWLSEDGAKQSDLKAIETDATLVGTPTISVGDRGALVTFASKTAPSEGWRAELAIAPRGAPPEHASPMIVPPGGPGGEAISPSSETLPGGRYVLQWTEGSAGNRAVRAQALSANLVPVGEAITLSTPDQNAGQGALWVHDKQVLALFLVKKETSHELWGASLRCP